MYRVVIDLSAVKTGGGAQRANNFLDTLLSSGSLSIEIILVVPDGHFERYTDYQDVVEVIKVPRNFLFRTLFEYIILRSRLRKLNVDLVYTFVGTGLLRIDSVPSVVGVAYPIICYDDSPYWEHLARFSAVKQKVKNHFRRKRLSLADLLIVQTPIMEERLREVLRDFQGRMEILAPAPSEYVSRVDRVEENLILILSGNEPHKNLWRLYEVAVHLNNDGFGLKFLITVNRDDWIASLKSKNIQAQIVDRYFEFVGGVNPREIGRLYARSKVMLQLSDLESFSNNYSEAWKAGIPVLASDRDFARSICEDAALYVEPHDPWLVAKTLKELLEDERMQKRLISAGDARLNTLPNQTQYFDSVLSLLADYKNA